MSIIFAKDPRFTFTDAHGDTTEVKGGAFAYTAPDGVDPDAVAVDFTESFTVNMTGDTEPLWEWMMAIERRSWLTVDGARWL